METMRVPDVGGQKRIPSSSPHRAPVLWPWMLVIVAWTVALVAVLTNQNYLIDHHYLLEESHLPLCCGPGRLSGLLASDDGGHDAAIEYADGLHDGACWSTTDAHKRYQRRSWLAMLSSGRRSRSWLLWEIPRSTGSFITGSGWTPIPGSLARPPSRSRVFSSSARSRGAASSSAAAR